VFTTPKSFLEFKDYYNKLLAEKRLFIKTKIDKLEKGLNIIEATNEQVVKIKAEVEEISVMVEKETKETEILIKKVGKEANIANKEKADANIKAEETNKITEDALATKAKADKALAEALPALDKAKAALGGLQPSDISDMTKIGNPVFAVCAVVIILMLLVWEWKYANKIKKIDFSDIEALRKIYKTGLGKLKPPGNFLKFITAWSGKQAYVIPEETKERVYAEIKNSVDTLGFDFDEKIYSSKGCLAASKLCSFINNILFFNKTYLYVKPLQEEMEAATALAN